MSNGLTVNVERFMNEKDETDLKREAAEEIVKILFGGVLTGGTTEIDWSDAPRVMGKLERLGLTVEGVDEELDYGRKRKAIKVSAFIHIRGLGPVG